jgi:hypothetical protein
MKDLNGVTIGVGDLVAYATRGSSVAYLRTGIVVALTDRDKIRVNVDGMDKIVTVGHGKSYSSVSPTVFVYKKARKKRAIKRK